jgi:GT2 family glycosyltransferase
MKITVIVPVHNGGKFLGRCLDALAVSTRRPDEVIVVDDGSTDETSALARECGSRVLSVPDGPVGPAAARNQGAGMAQGDILVFLDADVAVHPNALERIETHLHQNADVAALFGSYDDDPPDPGLVSRYKNLLHHHTHQHSRREASTFWAGCGAVRREVFTALGGFDKSYGQPSIEDIDLGDRLKRAGYRVWSCPGVQSTHLKRWTLASLVWTDIFNRAVPWTRLILRNGSLPDDLNLGTSNRLSALAAWAIVAALATGIVFPWAWITLMPALGVFYACNADFLRLLRRRGGTFFGLAASGLHLLYYLYSSATFAVVFAGSVLARGREALASPSRQSVAHDAEATA